MGQTNNQKSARPPVCKHCGHDAAEHSKTLNACPDDNKGGFKAWQYYEADFRSKASTERLADVAEALTKSGIGGVTVEYPGFLKIAISPAMVLALSTDGEDLALFVHDGDMTEVSETLESNLPSDFSNAKVIADWIYTMVKLAQEAANV